MNVWATSRKALPADDSAMASVPRWHLWTKQLRPYRDLAAGDELWWYETRVKAIVWRSRVADVVRFPYSSVADAADRLDDFFPGGIDRGDDYLTGKPGTGYCLGYRIDGLERVFLPKPDEVHFSQNGWESADRPAIATWIGRGAS